MAIAIVQQTTPSPTFNATSVAASFASLPAAGRCILVAAAVGKDGAGTITCTDNQGNTYTNVTAPGVFGQAHYWVSNNIGSPSGTFTVTLGSIPNGTANGGATMKLYEVSGQDTSSVIDSAATKTNTGNSDTMSTGTSGSTTVANAMAFAMSITEGFTSAFGGTTPATTGWTADFANQNGNNGPISFMDHKLLSATGTQSAAWGTGAVSDLWSAALVVLKEATAAATNVGQPWQNKAAMGVMVAQ